MKRKRRDSQTSHLGIDVNTRNQILNEEMGRLPRDKMPMVKQEDMQDLGQGSNQGKPLL